MWKLVRAAKYSPAQVAIHGFHIIVLAACKGAQLVEGHSWRERGVTQSVVTTLTESCQANPRWASENSCGEQWLCRRHQSLRWSAVNLVPPEGYWFQTPFLSVWSLLALRASALMGATLQQQLWLFQRWDSWNPLISAQFLTSEFSFWRANPHLFL